MNIIILGPQMSGKGTQAKLLVEKFGLNYIDIGNIMRSVMNSDNKYAQIVKEYYNKGLLVPEEYTRLIAWDHISKEDKNRGFIFDGYPRSIPQFEHLVDMLKKFGKRLDHVIFIKISPDEILRRLSGRRICEHCKKVFNLVTGPFPSGEKCDCGGNLITRSDDTPEATKNRLAYYNNDVLPLIDKVRGLGILKEVNGEQAIEKIHQEILEKLGV